MENIYDLGYKFIVEVMGVDEIILKENMQPNLDKPNSINSIYHQLIFSIQNNGRKHNYFVKILGNIDNLGEILGGFDPNFVIKKYGVFENPIGSSSIEKLVNEINDKWGPVDNMSKTGFLYLFSTGLLDGALLLNQFDTCKDFYKKIQGYIDSGNKEYVIDWLSSRVKGFGEATTSDFLKEIGYTEFGKLDTHIKNTLIGLGLASETMKDRDIMNKFYKYADLIQVSPYLLDKVIYIIGSGEIYINGNRVKYKPSRNDFISYCLEKNILF